MCLHYCVFAAKKKCVSFNFLFVGFNDSVSAIWLWLVCHMPLLPHSVFYWFSLGFIKLQSGVYGASIQQLVLSKVFVYLKSFLLLILMIDCAALLLLLIVLIDCTSLPFWFLWLIAFLSHFDFSYWLYFSVFWFICLVVSLYWFFYMVASTYRFLFGLFWNGFLRGWFLSLAGWWFLLLLLRW